MNRFATFLALTLSAVPAAAQFSLDKVELQDLPPYRGAPARPMVRCETSSNGYWFSDESRDPELAKRETTRKCRESRSTNNEECSANVACDGQYARPMVTCETSSNGYRFSDESRDPDLAKREATRQCRENRSTNNAECDANVACRGGHGRGDRGERRNPMVRCETSSNGYRFSDESRDRELAKREATRQCRENRSTNNQECTANVACDDEYPRPMVRCETSSNGYRFSDESRDPALARSEATRQCRENRSTNNEECNANVACYPDYR
jgi:hypothetical protein